MPQTLKVFGERVAIKQLNEELEGSIELPQIRNITHEIGQVLAVGDGKVGEDTKEMYTNVGDLLFFQTQKILTVSSVAMVNGDKAMFLHQGDMIARLNSKVVKLENLDMLGNWVLISWWADFSEGQVNGQNLIILPDNAVTPLSRQAKFKVVKKGNTCGDDFNVGDEVIIEKMRANPLKIDGIEYCYLDKSFIFAVAS